MQYQNISVSPQMSTRHEAGHQPDSQSTGANVTRVLTEHIDGVVAGSYQALLKRISTQDAILGRQQDSLDSVSSLIAANRNEFIKDSETLRIQLENIEKKTDRLTKCILDSMKLLATGTIKAITDCQTTIEKRLLCMEESCEGLREEICDSHANSMLYHSPSPSKSHLDFHSP